MLRLLAYNFLVFLFFHVFILIFVGAVRTVGFAEVLRAFGADAAWSSLIALILVSAQRLVPVWRNLAEIFSVGLITLFLVVSFGFAKLYERPFSLGFVRTDTASIWKENIISGLYELGWPHLLLFLGCAGLMLLASLKARAAQWPRRSHVALTIVGAVGALVLGGYNWGAQPSLISNPLSAALASRPADPLRADVALRDDDIIPALDSPELSSILPTIEVTRAGRRNVILYFLESTPMSVLGQSIQGKELTPNLNRLAQRSLLFTRHYANFPLSINAFYNAFCSAYALPDGAWISLALPDFPVPCLSEILVAEGYGAIALHAGYLGYAKQKRFMQKRGFAQMLDAETIKKAPFEKGMGPWGAADERAMIKPLVSFVQQKPDQPFLAVMFAFAPHHPYNVPDDFPPYIESDGDLKKSQIRFYNSLHFADDAFGEIVSALEEKGLLRNSILIVMGDHGEAFYQHPGNYNHPFFLYEENIHVPLMIYVDGVVPQRSSRVTSHVDILPTVLDLLRLERKLSPLHVGQSMLRRGPQSLAHVQAYWQDEYSGIVGERFKYIRKGNGGEELFDLHQDAAEKQNLAAIKPEVTGSYRTLTEKAFAQKKAYYKKHGNYDLTRFNPATQDK